MKSTSNNRLFDDSIDGQMMITAAHRYCLERRSYAVNCCVDWLKSKWTQLNNQTQSTVVRDTLEHLQDSHLREEPEDIKLQWKDFAEWAWKQLSKEEKKFCQLAIAHRNKPWPLTGK